VDEVKQKLENYVKAIQNKEFKATPDEWTCRYCDYNDICSESAK
jgi:CRISPR/Cas system-associated exonuclease Cas4 (RecB family)